MVSIGSDLSRVTGEGLHVAPDTGLEGTLGTKDGDPDDARLALYRSRSRREDDEAHVQNVSSIRR